MQQTIVLWAERLPDLYSTSFGDLTSQWQYREGIHNNEWLITIGNLISHTVQASAYIAIVIIIAIMLN